MNWIEAFRGIFPSCVWDSSRQVENPVWIWLGPSQQCGQRSDQVFVFL
jgi:hypothetical protein